MRHREIAEAFARDVRKLSALEFANTGVVGKCYAKARCRTLYREG